MLLKVISISKTELLIITKTSPNFVHTNIQNQY